MSPLIGNDYDLLNAVSKLAGHLFRLIPIGTVEYHGKFIAAQPADYSPITYHVFELTGNSLQQAVSQLMATQLVDILESIQIDEKQCSRFTFEPGIIDETA